MCLWVVCERDDLGHLPFFLLYKPGPLFFIALSVKAINIYKDERDAPATESLFFFFFFSFMGCQQRIEETFGARFILLIKIMLAGRDKNE